VYTYSLLLLRGLNPELGGEGEGGSSTDIWRLHAHSPSCGGHFMEAGGAMGAILKICVLLTCVYDICKQSGELYTVLSLKCRAVG
jgi:hypothetical protein